MKNKLVLIVAVLVGILAFWLSARYLEKERAKLYEGAVKIKVIVARRDLPAMSILKAEDLGMKSVYKSAVGDNVFLPEDFNKIKGKRLKYPLKRNEPVWWTHVDLPRVEIQKLSTTIQYDGRKKNRYRAISVPISGASAVSGMITPGDYVDILGTFTLPSRINPAQMESVTFTLFPKVKVLAVGQQLGTNLSNEEQRQSSGYSTVTFEVEPEMAEVLVFAIQSRGQLYLTLRNPDDPSKETTNQAVNFERIEDYLPTLNAQRGYDEN